MKDRAKGLRQPVREGERHRIKIEGIGRAGDGFAKIGGLIVFVPNTAVGDELDVRISKITQRAAFAEKLE